jgi:hypothetical protein
MSNDYFQTWQYVARIGKRNKWRAKIIQFLCGLLTGHELSKTEWGYGGGNKVDRWCRWCNKLIAVDADSFWFQSEKFREFGGLVGKEEGHDGETD